jgi:hypothetical protein
MPVAALMETATDIDLLLIYCFFGIAKPLAAHMSISLPASLMRAFF